MNSLLETKLERVNGNIAPLYRGEEIDVQFTSIDELEFK